MRQRDDLKAAATVCKWKPGMLEKALASPVFQWWHGGGSLGEQDYEFMMENILERIEVEFPNQTEKHAVMWPRFTPYECFRISLMDSADYYQWWITKDSMTCFHCDDRASHKEVKCWTMHHKDKSRLTRWHFGMWVNEMHMELPDVTYMDANRDELQEFKMGKVHLRVSFNEMSRYASHVVKIMGLFMFDIYGSGSTVVKVSPKPDPTKSVQWRQSREHYLVLRRQQVENMISTKGEATNEDLVRSAHWRRAHLRRLSSNKFINKRGLLVPVKKAWVGPTEWEGNDGKIYTVVGMEPPPLTGNS